MIACLGGSEDVEFSRGWRHHLKVMARFEQWLAANGDRPAYLAEICAALGVSQRTLNLCCREHLGVSPTRYLWLRRMHLTRHSLSRAEPAETTVSTIAMNHGFWELGRFSVAYRRLLGSRPERRCERLTTRGPSPAGRLSLSPRPMRSPHSGRGILDRVTLSWASEVGFGAYRNPDGRARNGRVRLDCAADLPNLHRPFERGIAPRQPSDRAPAHTPGIGSCVVLWPQAFASGLKPAPLGSPDCDLRRSFLRHDFGKGLSEATFYVIETTGAGARRAGQPYPFTVPFEEEH